MLKYSLFLLCIFAFCSFCTAQDNRRLLLQHQPPPLAKQFYDRGLSVYFGQGQQSNDEDKDSVLAAARCIDSATTIDADYYLAYEEGANFYLVAKDYNRSLLSVKNMIRLNPGSAELYRYEGVLYFKIGDDERSLKAFQKSLELYEQDVEIATAMLDTMTSDTVGGRLSDGVKRLREAHGKVTMALDDKAIGLVLINARYGKTLMDSLSTTTDQEGRYCYYKDLRMQRCSQAAKYKDKTKAELVEMLISGKHTKSFRPSLRQAY